MTRGFPPNFQRDSLTGVDPGGEPSDAASYGTYFLGRYRVVDEIGVGGMASVHLARMDGAGGFQKWVAIKKIHPHLSEDEEFINMFLDEARIAAGISHPNVAQVYELACEDGPEKIYWIAMEYLHGEPLRELMRVNEESGTCTSPELAARIIIDAAEGLHAAHELRGKKGEPLNLVHRDVSPHNLFVTYDGVTKVVDFGIAKVSGRLASTRAGTLKGKLAYMSPEQVRGASIDRRTDVFALGVVLWEMVTGQRLFRMESDLETLEKVQACVVPPPSTVRPDVPAELESVIMRALQKRIDTRFQTARELSRALQQFLMHAGSFVGHEEVSAYINSIFADRIRQRDEHLRWAAEVTKTISLDQVRELASPTYEEISIASYDPSSEAVSSAAREGSSATVAQKAAAAAPAPQRAAPAGRAALPVAHGIHMPAPRMPPEIASPPAKSVVISATPPSGPDLLGAEDDDEEIATIVAPSRLLLDGPGNAPMGAGMPASGPGNPSYPRSAPTMPPPNSIKRTAIGFPAAPMPGPMPDGYGPPQPYPGQPMQPMPYGQPGYPVPPGSQPQPYYPAMMPARTDETQQLQSVRSNHAIVYVAAALGTFFIVVGLAAVLLLRSRAQAQVAPPAQPSATVAQTAPAPTPTPEKTAAPQPTHSATVAAAEEPPPKQPEPEPPPKPTTAKTSTPPKPTGGGGGTTTKPPTPTTEKAEPGFLTVVCSPFCDAVIAGGRNLGPSPVVHVPLAPGQYRVTLRRSGGSTKVIPAIIVSGQVTSHRVSMD